MKIELTSTKASNDIFEKKCHRIDNSSRVQLDQMKRVDLGVDDLEAGGYRARK
jgi:hypothetical protein